MKKWVIVTGILLLLLALGGTIFYITKSTVAPEAAVTKQQLETNEAYEFLLRNNRERVKNHKYVVLINPSHGGADKGAVVLREDEEICESEIALEVARNIRNNIEDTEIAVIFTRDTDTNPELELRKGFITEYPVDLVVDLHVSADDDSGIFGTTTYYTSDFYRYDFTNQELADIVERNLVTAIEGKALGIVDIDGNSDMQEYDFIRGSRVPSVAVSMGYITGEQEGSFLADSDYQKTIAIGLGNGIKEALDRVGK